MTDMLLLYLNLNTPLGPLRIFVITEYVCVQAIQQDFTGELILKQLGFSSLRKKINIEFKLQHHTLHASFLYIELKQSRTSGNQRTVNVKCTNTHLTIQTLLLTDSVPAQERDKNLWDNSHN